MPTYQYSCTECGHFFEQFQAFTDDALTQCPVCQGRLRKVFNAVGVVFKGSGFYRNDSRAGSGSESGSEKSGAEKSEKSGADSGAKKSGSGDSSTSSDSGSTKSESGGSGATSGSGSAKGSDTSGSKKSSSKAS